MSTQPGYVHVSARNGQNRRPGPTRARVTAPNTPTGTGYGYPSSAVTPPYFGSAAANPNPRSYQSYPATAPTPVVSTDAAGPQAVPLDSTARGFVLYVGLDENDAAAAGTSLAKLAQELRSYIRALAPEAQSHAAVAIAPDTASGTDLEVVRKVLGDPTIARVPQRAPVPVPLGEAERPTGVLVDLSRREVYLDGESLDLTYKEFELLNFLVDNSSRTVRREELIKDLWSGTSEVPNQRTIDVHVRRLRSKLGRLSSTVRTIRGQGYRFYDHPEVVIWSAPEYSI